MISDSMREAALHLLVAFSLCALAPIQIASAQQGRWAEFQRAEELFAIGEYAESRRLHEVIAGDTAYAPSQFRLGWMYQLGLGVQANCATAARWFTYAAGQKYDAAAYNLFSIYSTGCPGLQPDERRAYHWLARAAALGNTVAMARLSLSLAEAEGTDTYAAYDMAQRAAAASDDGFPKSVIGVFTALGYGIPADRMKGRSLLLQGWRIPSMYSGHRRFTARALYSIAYGDGETPQDAEEAYKWLLVTQYLGGTVDDQKLAVAREGLRPESVSAIQADARRTASDTVGTVLRNDEVFIAAVESAKSNPAQAIELSQHLTSIGDVRADLLEGILFHLGVGRPPNADEALLRFKRGCTNTPQGVSCLMLAEVLLQQGLTEEAVHVLSLLAEETSNAEMPWNGSLRLRLGEALERAGLVEQARTIARGILAADKENERAVRLLKD